MFGNKPFDKSFQKKYLAHERIDNLLGLEVELVYEWKVGSMLIFDNCCYTQSGGGIVVDSNANYEYNENNLKARALLELLS